MFEFEACDVLKIKEFTFVNDCFQNKHNEKIGHYGQTLSNIDIKRLKGEEANHFRLRINKIRFVYKVMIKENIILFYNAGYRGDVYK